MIEILPYVEIGGTRTVSDDMLANVWLAILEDGSHEKLFHNDKVKTEEEFIKFLKDPSNLPAFILVDGKIMGVAWLNRIAKNHAFAHFCFLKESWGKYTKEMGKAILKYWFSLKKGDFQLDVLIGATPENNRLAINFIKKLGFTILTPPIPHIEFGVISFMTRENYG